MTTLKPSSSSSSTSSSSSSAQADNHKDKDNDDDRNDSKKNKNKEAMTSPSAPPRLSPAQHFTEFPDVLILELRELFDTSSLLRLVESSKGLRDAYDGHVQEAELFWHQENSPGSFSNFCGVNRG